MKKSLENANKSMKCKTCGKAHSESYHLKNKLTDKGFPTHDPKYKSAHEEATKEEKARYPKANYDRLKRMDESVPKETLIGKNTQSGKIEVSKIVPKDLRAEVAFHEKVENQKLLMKKHGKNKA